MFLLGIPHYQADQLAQLAQPHLPSIPKIGTLPTAPVQDPVPEAVGTAEVAVQEILDSIQAVHSTNKIQILTPAALVDFQIPLQEEARVHLPAEEEVDNAYHFYNLGNCS